MVLHLITFGSEVHFYTEMQEAWNFDIRLICDPTKSWNGENKEYMHQNKRGKQDRKEYIKKKNNELEVVKR